MPGGGQAYLPDEAFLLRPHGDNEVGGTPLKSGFQALADYYAKFFQTQQLRNIQNEMKQQDQYQSMLERASGDQDVEQRLRQLTAIGKLFPKHAADVQSMMPSDRERMQPLMGRISGAKNIADLPDLPSEYAARGLDTSTFPPELQDALQKALERRKASFGEQQQFDIAGKSSAVGAEERARLGAINDNFPTKLDQDTQEAKMRADVAVDEAGRRTGAEKRAALAPDIVSGEASAAGKKAGAEAAARLPYEKQKLSYEEEMKESYERAKASNAKLPATEVERMANLNVAEQESVKIMRALQLNGLSNVNDPADPRWQKFVAGTLKMEPGQMDAFKGDMQQRTAAVQALVSRSLMGGRPSQYVMELMLQHLPDGAMTGAKLFSVLNNVMQQTQEQYEGISRLSGVPVQKIKPPQNSYDQFVTEQQTQQGPQAPPDLHPAVQSILSQPRR